jgi:hypothetical protein
MIRGRMGRMRVEKYGGGCGWENLGCGGVEKRMWAGKRGRVCGLGKDGDDVGGEERGRMRMGCCWGVAGEDMGGEDGRGFSEGVECEKNKP